MFSAAAGIDSADATYYAQVCWVRRRVQEGAPSEMTTYDAPAGSMPVVRAVNPPAVATGFNVYLGLTPDTLALQNPTPVAVGQSFTLAGRDWWRVRRRETGKPPTSTSAAAGC